MDQSGGGGGRRGDDECLEKPQLLSTRSLKRMVARGSATGLEGIINPVETSSPAVCKIKK